MVDRGGDQKCRGAQSSSPLCPSPHSFPLGASRPSLWGMELTRVEFGSWPWSWGYFSDWGAEAPAKVAWPGPSRPLFPGLSLQQQCPPGSAKCRKKCEQEYYVDRDGRCTACVSCSGGRSLSSHQGLLPGAGGGGLAGQTESPGEGSPELGLGLLSPPEPGALSVL